MYTRSPRVGLEPKNAGTPRPAEPVDIDSLRDELKKVRAQLSPASIVDVQIEFQDLSYNVEVPIATSTVKSVGSTMLSTITCGGAGTATRSVLSRCSGVLVPGTLTLIIGPPGSGKSSLMKALSARINPTQLHGRIWYGKRPAKEVNVPRVVGYVDQTDNHFPQLTVEQTFLFSGRCMINMDVVHQQDLRQRLDPAAYVSNVIRLLKLQRAKDTPIGDELNRGVSGGECKRVTVGEMLMGNYRALFFDEISTGLDSATTRDVISILRAAADELGLVIVVALLQPPPEVFELFDRVMLMRDGCIVYHGPRDNLESYFTDMGLPCPSDADPADFYEEFLSDPVRIWEAEKVNQRKAAESLRDPWSTPLRKTVPPLTTEEMQLYFKASLQSENWAIMTRSSPSVKVKQPSSRVSSSPVVGLRASPTTVPVRKLELMEGLQSLHDEDGEGDADEKRILVAPSPVGLSPFVHSEPTQGPHFLCTAFVPDSRTGSTLSFTDPEVIEKYGHMYTTSSWTQFKNCFGRSLTLMMASKKFYYGRIIQMIVQALIIGSLFWATPVAKFQVRLALLFLCVTTVAAGTTSEVKSACLAKSIVLKQHTACMYSIPIFVLSSIVTQLVVTLVETILFSSIVYWMAGMAKEGDRFIFFLFVVFLTGLSFSALFRLVAFAAPSKKFAEGLKVPILTISMLFAGFMLTRKHIPFFLREFYWVSPLSWSLRSIAQNEFYSEIYNKTVVLPSGNETAGVFNLLAYDVYLDPLWKWSGIAYLLGFFVVVNVLGIIALSRSTLSAGRFLPYFEDKKKDIAPSVIQRELALVKDQTAESEFVPPRAWNAVTIQPVSIAFTNLTYTAVVEGKPRPLLNRVSGFALPGTMTALMGSSGAGKTTLLDVISGRKTVGDITGDILVNGKPKDDEEFRRITGYVEQQDIHDPYTTVQEGLLFSARTRMRIPLPDKDLVAFVDDIMKLLELTDVANVLVGPSDGGLPVGEKKRYTIGVELVTNPSVLFLDEPTSGLDSRSASIVMRVIEKFARSGRTVIATIHQPSADIFYRFDQLLLLKPGRNGGEVAYFGDLGTKAVLLVEYLQKATGKTIPLHANPANWMLDVMSGVTTDGLDLAEHYKGSGLLEDYVDAHSKAELGLAGAGLGTRSFYNPNVRSKFPFVFERTAKDYWRNVGYNLTRFRVLTFLGLLFGIVWFNIPAVTLGGVSSKMAALFFVILSPGLTSLTSSVMPAMELRAVYYREQAARAYPSWMYSLSIAIVEIPYCALSVVPYVIIFYFMANLNSNAEDFFQFLLTIMALSYTFNGIGHLVTASSPNLDVALTLAGVVGGLSNNFSGFFIPRASIPRGWIWLFWINPSAHAASAIVYPQFYCDPAVSTCPFIELPGSTVTVSQYVYNYLHFSYSNRWLFTLSTFLMGIGYRLLGAVVLRYVSFLKR